MAGSGNTGLHSASGFVNKARFELKTRDETGVDLLLVRGCFRVTGFVMSRTCTREIHFEMLQAAKPVTVTAKAA